jgi:hypothetical protein
VACADGKPGGNGLPIENDKGSAFAQTVVLKNICTDELANKADHVLIE